MPDKHTPVLSSSLQLHCFGFVNRFTWVYALTVCPLNMYARGIVHSYHGFVNVMRKTCFSLPFLGALVVAG